jgi:hypothetical protein
MSPPELDELTALVYADAKVNASEKKEKKQTEDQAAVEPLPARLLASLCGLFALLNEESFAQLIAANERFHRTEAAKQVLNFTVLVDLLGGAQDRRRDNLQRIGVRDAVTLKALWFFAVEKGENGAAGPQQLGEIRNGLLRQNRFEIVEQIPNQHGIEAGARILEIFGEKTDRTAGGSHVRGLRANRGVQEPLLVLREEILPFAKNVFGGDAKAAFDEKAERGLRGGAKVEERTAAQTIQIPKQFF